jgi:hypothetical protein
MFLNQSAWQIGLWLAGAGAARTQEQMGMRWLGVSAAQQPAQAKGQVFAAQRLQAALTVKGAASSCFAGG